MTPAQLPGPLRFTARFLKQKSGSASVWFQSTTGRDTKVKHAFFNEPAASAEMEQPWKIVLLFLVHLVAIMISDAFICPKDSRISKEKPISELGSGWRPPGRTLEQFAKYLNICRYSFRIRGRKIFTSNLNKPCVTAHISGDQILFRENRKQCFSYNGEM